MPGKRSIRFFILLMVFGLVAAACSSDDSDGGTETTMDAEMDMEDDHDHEGDMEMDMDMAFAFGDPMDAGMADRVVEISAGDSFRFDPESVAVTAGETITFRVTNDGAIPHDFVLGDAAMQDEHEAEMADMASGGDMSHDEPNAFVIEPGETKEMTWHMTQSGEILFGCHQPGHFAAGMKGTITVSG
jgi:uncharacterized cupredoxin-like copper-binding protein